MQKWIILTVVCLILVIGTVIVLNVDIETEYIPETEIEDIELRKTIVTLYFNNKETNEISKETRLIDSKSLLKNPYKELINMVINGPENDKLEKVIPDGTKVLDAKCESGIVTINFSKEFSENASDESIQTAYDVLKKTLTELTEVNSIKILVEGTEIINENNEKMEPSESIETAETEETSQVDGIFEQVDENNLDAEDKTDID